jgi:hypothetical protein
MSDFFKLQQEKGDGNNRLTASTAGTPTTAGKPTTAGTVTLVSEESSTAVGKGRQLL